MGNFRKLFAAIDFSTASDEALKQAHERAIFTGAERKFPLKSSK
jgi:hypothetical protein